MILSLLFSVGTTVVLLPRKRIWTEGQHCSLEEEQIYSSFSKVKAACATPPPEEATALPVWASPKKIRALCRPCFGPLSVTLFSFDFVWKLRFILRNEGACLNNIKLFLVLLPLPLSGSSHQYKAAWGPLAQLTASASISRKRES